ncbi:activated Cdc42 kinase-like isoform X1 [Planococcus citri]|uniref:activated Cdc42 kinase-like isoform X1 n=1 Tax=Planococcus citri TaxID=170843 RepID=UPI0031FA2B16
MSHTKGPGLYEFLIEAELQQYYSGLKNDLKVQNVAHLKYVAEQDLDQLGMTKPEIRRLKKFYLKHFPQNYFAKFKKMILSKEEKDSWDLMIPEDNGLDSKPPVRVPNKHIIPADSILVNKELGTGEFGVVQQGVWTNEGERIQVAIKCLSRERMQSNPIEFLKEAAIMHSIDHEHIVRLYGVVLDTNALMLVTELAPLRSLLECLKEPSLRSSFPVLTLCDFSIQICDGMQYLETKRLIHRDLAARNILVFSKNKVKISDFGLSRALGVGKDYYQTNFNVNLKLPIAWCAPECISYLRFTSASDVWAYGVTLWEMFSYGFQPWAALTGHQILEAIDEPNFQRLEHPECCPKEYYSLMLKCWQHDPNKRPRFSDLMTLLPECKPEQVQAIQDSVDERMKRDQLPYRVGDVITVLNKSPVASIPNCWKGVLNNGKSGLFNPAHTVAYIGSNLPSNKPGEFVRGESKIYASRRSKLRPEMISRPQGELKHTGHVGLDGAYFGDISFLGSGTKYNHLPHQIVTPYKPQDDCTNSTEPSTPSKIFSDRAPLLSPEKGKSTHSSNIWLDYESIRAPCNSASKCGKLTDHEYHEIGNEELNAESPRFEKTFDFGPSLLDEMDAMFKTLGSEKNNSMVAGVSNYASSPPPSPLDADINKRNELREIAASVAATMHKGKKKQAMVKPISAADEKTLDSAIAMANELAARSLNDLDSKSHQLPDSPVTPVSPNKRKFSFRFPTPVTGHSSSRPEGKTFSDEAASIPDIQGCLSEEAKVAYNALIEQPAVSNAVVMTHVPPVMETVSPLKMLKAVPVIRSKSRANKNQVACAADQATSSTSNDVMGDDTCPEKSTSEMSALEKVDGCNAIPLPPRDRSKPLNVAKPRHQRKHPLIIPGGEQRLLDKVNITENENANVFPGAELINSESSEFPVSTSKFNEPVDDSFDQRIASELDALDNLQLEQSSGSTQGCDIFSVKSVTESNGPDVMICSTPKKPTTLTIVPTESAISTENFTPFDTPVSCEDLVDLNEGDKTPVIAAHAPERKTSVDKGTNSDKVRIMEKVLGPRVSGEQCVSALNITDWDVHRAIKLARLESLLSNDPRTRNVTDKVTNISALEAMNWDVAKAATLIINNLKAT